jgi:hypothetical protein
VWQVGDGFETWAATLRADDVVFIAFRALYPTQRRKSLDARMAFRPAGAIPYLLDPREVFSYRTAVLVDVDLHTRRVVRLETMGFSEQLEGQEIPAALANLTEALQLGRPIAVYEPATDGLRSE